MATCKVSRQVAPSQPLMMTIGALQPIARKVAQHLDAGVLAERKIERNAIERVSLRERCRLLVTGRSRRHVAGLGCGPADNHAVQIVVVDDEKTLWQRRIKVRIVRCKRPCLSEHFDRARRFFNVTRVIGEFVRNLP